MTLPYTMPINPVHSALMNNGKVLIVSGSGWVAGNTNYLAAVWDPVPARSRSKAYLGHVLQRHLFFPTAGPSSSAALSTMTRFTVS